MKPTYNVFANTANVRNWNEKMYTEMFKNTEVEIIETPTCFLRIRKDDLNNTEYINHIKSHFAVFRTNPNPKYNTTVQWSIKKGKWINGETFHSAAEAKNYVIEQNKRLIPFANSPYIEYNLSEVQNED